MKRFLNIFATLFLSISLIAVVNVFVNVFEAKNNGYEAEFPIDPKVKAASVTYEIADSPENAYSAEAETTTINNSIYSDSNILKDFLVWKDSDPGLVKKAQIIPDTYFDEDAQFEKRLNVAGDGLIEGGLAIGGYLKVDGDARFKDKVTIDEGDVKINGVEYHFPEEQASDEGYVLANDGEGNLDWISQEEIFPGISGTDNRLARFNAAGTGIEDASINDLYSGGVSLTIDSNGGVGIGTTATLYDFEVNGTSNFTSFFLNSVLITASASEINSLSGFTADAGAVTFGDGSGITNDQVNFYWDDSSDSLGIGTSAPTRAVDVVGGIAATDDVYISGIGLNDTTGTATSGASRIGVFDELQNTNATNLQDVLDDLDASITTFSAGAGDIESVGSMAAGDTFNSSAADDQWLGLGTSAGRIEFDDQTIDEVNILNANVGIGTTGPSDTLHVVGDILATGGFHVGADSTNNYLSTASTGAGSTTLYIGNESILTSGDIGTSVQAYDAELSTMAGLSPDDGNFIVGNGSTWVVESGNTARTSLGLGTGDSPTFTDLTLSGNATLGNAAIDTVTSNAAAWTFSNATSVNIASSAQALSFENGLLNLDTSNNRVGVGTTAPAYAFEVQGTAGGIALTRTSDVSTVEPFILFRKGTTISDLAQIRGIDGGGLRFANGNATTEWARISSTGNFGIGTTAPTNKLVVSQSVPTNTQQGGIVIDSTYAAASSVGSLDFRINGNPNGAASIGVPTNGVTAELAFYTTTSFTSVAPTEKLRINSTGNIGVGSTNPNALLSVGSTNQFNVNSSGNISRIGGGNHSIAASGSNMAITSAGELIFDDSSVSTTIQLSDTDTTLPNSNIGIIDAINDAYNAAVGSSGGVWSLSSGVISPTTATNDFAIGGSTLAASIFSIDESAGTFLFGGDQTANPTLRFEATDSDTADIVFDTDDAFQITGGNVGIGNTAAQELLTLTSTTDPTLRIDPGGNTTVDPTIALYDTATTAGFELIYDNSVGSTLFRSVYDNAAGDLFFQTTTGGTVFNRLMIDNSGIIGIGTTVPTDTVHVVGDVFATGGFHVGADATANYISTASAGASSTTLYIGNESILASGDIGSSVQAYDAGLTSIAGLTTLADRMIYTTASDTYAVTTLTSFARTLLDDSDAATARSTLGITSGGAGDIWVDEAGDTVTGALTMSQNGTDVLDFSFASTNDARGISFNNRTALSSDSSDGYLRLNNGSEFTNGVFTPGNLRVDGVYLAENATPLASAPQYSFDGDTNTGMYRTGVDNLGFTTGGTLRMNINSSGYVSIGQASANDPLDILYSQPSSATNNAMEVDAENTLSDTSSAINLQGIEVNLSNTGSDSSGTTIYGIAGTASNTQSSTAVIAHNTYGVYGAAVGNTNGQSNAYGVYCSASGADNNYCGGNQTWTQFSDARIKTDISTIDNAIGIINSLKGVRYRRTDDGSDRIHVGFIAQDVLPYLPEVVSYDSGIDRYSMAYAEITPVLVNAIQEQQIEIDKIINSSPDSLAHDEIFAMKLEKIEEAQQAQQASINEILQKLLRLDALEATVANLGTNLNELATKLNVIDEAMAFVKGTGDALASLIIKVPTVFSEMAFFEGPIKVNADTSETVEIPKGTLKAKITFNKSFPQKPTIYLNFVDTVPVEYKLVDINEDGFSISFEDPTAKALKIQWLAILRDVNADAPSLQIIESENGEESKPIIDLTENVDVTESIQVQESTESEETEEDSSGFAEPISEAPDTDTEGIVSTSSSDDSNGIEIGGVSVIEAGATSVVVETSQLAEGSSISVTTDASVLLKTLKIDDTKFEISVDQPYPFDININWEIQSSE